MRRSAGRRLVPHRERSAALLPLLLVVLMLLGGCAWISTAGGAGGRLRAESFADKPIVLPGRYDQVVYAYDPKGDTTFILSDVSMEALADGTVTQGQILHIELLWQPKPGATPMDESATNVSIRQIIISNGEVGLYGGSGFADTSGRLGAGRLSVSLQRGIMRLIESTGGFRDPLSPARLTGSFTARHDEGAVRGLYRAVSQFVTNAFGETRFVDGGVDVDALSGQLASAFQSNENSRP